MLFPGASLVGVASLLTNMAVATVYGQDKHWAAKLKAGKTSFDGSPGWHQALQELIDMNGAGCFQSGFTGTSTASVIALFAQGQGLMSVGLSSGKASVEAANPQFSFSHHPFPGGTAPNQTTSFLNINPAVSVNAHSDARSQAAAQTFVDFIARPKQNALFTQTTGSLSQYEFLEGNVPDHMAGDASVLAQHTYVVNPSQSWWNANVLLALQKRYRPDHGAALDRRRPERDGRCLEAGAREGSERVCDPY